MQKKAQRGKRAKRTSSPFASLCHAGEGISQTAACHSTFSLPLPYFLGGIRFWACWILVSYPLYLSFGEEEAARAYDLAALKYWGVSAPLNFPVSDYGKELEKMQEMSRREYLLSIRSGFDIKHMHTSYSNNKQTNFFASYGGQVFSESGIIHENFL